MLFICPYNIKTKILKKIEEINNKHVYEFHNQYNNNAFLEFNAFLKFNYVSEITKLYINQIEYLLGIELVLVFSANSFIQY